ncbi:MAG: RING finger protein, partial [Terracidiphilus sp.]
MTVLICPYCRTDIGAQDHPLLCEGCGAAHHADCYAENGGCTIFGCSKAPGDEPKVSVSTPELVVAAAPATQVRRRMPPPPAPGVIPSPFAPHAAVDLQHVANRVVPSMFGGFAGED